MIAGALERAQETAQHHEEQRREHAPERDAQIAAGKRRDLRLLAHGAQHGFGMPKQRRGQHAIAEHRPHAHAHGAADGDTVSPALGLRHHRHDGIGKARTEDEDGEEHLRGKNHRRKFGRAEPADHQDIRGMDRELRQLRADEGHAEHDAGAIMRRPGIIGAHARLGVGRSQHDEV